MAEVGTVEGPNEAARPRTCRSAPGPSPRQRLPPPGPLGSLRAPAVSARDPGLQVLFPPPLTRESWQPCCCTRSVTALISPPTRSGPGLARTREWTWLGKWMLHSGPCGLTCHLVMTFTSQHRFCFALLFTMIHALNFSKSKSK